MFYMKQICSKIQNDFCYEQRLTNLLRGVLHKIPACEYESVADILHVQMFYFTVILTAAKHPNQCIKTKPCFEKGIH